MKMIDANLYSDIGGRPENEDTGMLIWASRKTLNAIVCDGLGGQGDGKAASGFVCRELSYIGNTDEPMEGEFLGTAIADANQELMKLQHNKFHMKTTVVYLRIEDDTVLWAHIGDSRLYHFYQGKLAEYTIDHSLSQMAVLMGQITRDEIPQHSGRSRLYHAMGSDGETAEVAEKKKLAPGKHSFLLCSDGYWEYLKDREIEDALAGSATAEQWHQKMLAMILARAPEDTDNRTAITIMMEV